MALFRRKEKTEVSPSSPVENTIPDLSKLISSYEEQLRELDDMLYGIALFFECISLLHADQPAVVETYRKQLRNIIQRGKELSNEASEILAHISKNSRDKEPLKRIKLNLAEEMPDAELVIKRAKILVQLYENLFPARPRSQEFIEEELFKLIEAAGEKFDEL